MPGKTSYGLCTFCGGRKSKGTMLRHLRKCLADAELFDGSKVTEFMLLRVQDPYGPHYWLDLLMKQDLRLRHLDQFLRNIWLECCGHMSEFYLPPHRKIGKDNLLVDAFPTPGDLLNYVYDFGSSTELVITFREFTTAAVDHPLHLSARNEAPVFPCTECGRAAKFLCVECVYDEAGFLCPAHAEEHECGEEMLLPVVNSPRMGVCGYTGSD